MWDVEWGYRVMGVWGCGDVGVGVSGCGGVGCRMWGRRECGGVGRVGI